MIEKIRIHSCHIVTFAQGGMQTPPKSIPLLLQVGGKKVQISSFPPLNPKLAQLDYLAIAIVYC